MQCVNAGENQYYGDDDDTNRGNSNGDDNCDTANENGYDDNTDADHDRNTTRDDNTCNRHSVFYDNIGIEYDLKTKDSKATVPVDTL